MAVTHEGPLFSSRWYRVASLRPQLRQHVELRRQNQRGVDWYLLIDGSADDVRRLNRAAYEFVGRCDGALTVQQVWEDLLAAQPDQVMTQDEVLQLLVALHERRLVEFDSTPDVEALFRSRDAGRRRKRWAGVNPLAFRLSLCDPSPWLARAGGVARALFSVPALAVWLLLMLFGLAAAALHGGELASHAGRVTASPRYLFMAWLLYPLIKGVHEGAHALAMRRWGATVRQAGITLLMLTPVPFVNASAADAFRLPRQRAIVSAAGIMAELTLAALAMGVWLGVQPGLVKDLALLTMLIGALSTLLVNGNPLMRFDGYYLFCDLLDLRNLASRSGRYWSGLLLRGALGVTTPTPIELLPGERRWLLAYAPLATAYRLGLGLTVSLWVGSHSALLGLAMGSMMLIATVGKPLQAALKAVQAHARPRRLARVGTITLAALALLTLLPLPFSTVAQGVVWLPERAQIRAGAEGFVAAYAVADGQAVRAGELLVTLQDERLAAKRATLLADATELEVALFRALDEEPDKVPALRERLAYSRAEAARTDERIAQLQIRAGSDGIVVMPRQADLQGSFHKKGALLGHLLTDEPLTVRVALPQDDASLVRQRAGAVGVWVAGDAQALHSGRIERDMAGAVGRLPSAALGDRSGGRIATDGQDAEGLTPLEPVVLVDVQVPDLQGELIGARAWVRFDHGTLPVAGQVLRRLQQLVLQHFNPSA